MDNIAFYMYLISEDNFITIMYKSITQIVKLYQRRLVTVGKISVSLIFSD